MNFINVSRPVVDHGLMAAYDSLRKTLTAGGGGNAAPGALTGGESLGKEHNIDKLYRYFGKKPVSKAILKKALPHLSDEKVQKIIDLINKKHEEQH
jgi:hypothetical protein